MTTECDNNDQDEDDHEADGCDGNQQGMTP